MPNLKIAIILSLAIVFVVPTIAKAAITFTNGFWSQDFNSGNCTQNWIGGGISGPWTCGGIDSIASSIIGYNCDYQHSDGNGTCLNPPTNIYSLVTTAADRIGGTGKSGFRSFRGPCQYGDGSPLNTNKGGHGGCGDSVRIEPYYGTNDLYVDATDNKKVKSVGYHGGASFDSGDTGNAAHIVIFPGGNWTPGVYQILSTSNGWATLNASPAPVGTTGGTWGLSHSENGSGGLITKFNDKTIREVWIRWYQRWEPGYIYNTSAGGIKMIYTFLQNQNDVECTGPGTPCSCCGTTNGCTSSVLAKPIFQVHQTEFDMGAVGSIPYNQHNTYPNQPSNTGHVCPNGYYGFQCVYPPSAGNNYTAGVSDGSWHLFEVHYKLNSPTASDGAFQAWVDGFLVLGDTHVGMNLNLCTAKGFDSFDLPSNGGMWDGIVGGLQHSGYEDVDDLAVAIPGYAGFGADANGYTEIGPIGAPPLPPDTIPPAAPSGVMVS